MRAMIQFKSKESQIMVNVEANEIIRLDDSILVLNNGVLVGMWKLAIIDCAYLTKKENKDIQINKELQK